MRPHGEGEFFYQDGTSARGIFDYRSGVIDFKGKFPRSPLDHTMLEGEWNKGVGQAQISFSNGDRYQGGL